MIFNSYIFIFLFLPITLGGYFIIGQLDNHKLSITWLVVASLFFYGWWNPAYLILIISSILFNYSIGLALRSYSKNSKNYSLLAVGILGNLGLIGYYKYANFFVDGFNWALDLNFHLETIILPLAISFFTFQQIAYLVDVYNREISEHNFLNYCLFVTFFPQLIAGPIVHHKEMLPQFAKSYAKSLSSKNIAIGITIFTIGLFKKVILADGISEYATLVFDASERGLSLTFFEAWAGALAYTFQIYFDFSGYSDMAIGLARMFGIRLPLNFNSPYKAANIIDFWRRWHITLSRFLRDYVYIPLGGNRKGVHRRYINIITTMLLGGLWHGAGWTFILWGGLHGIYIAINHAWHSFYRSLGHDLARTSFFGCGVAKTITFMAIIVSWVLFRAESLEGATNMFGAMIGHNGFSFPMQFSDQLGSASSWLEQYGFVFLEGERAHSGWLPGILMIILLFLLSWLAPNTQQIMERGELALNTDQANILANTKELFIWKPTPIWAILTSVTIALSLYFLSRDSEFLYFQF